MQRPESLLNTATTRDAERFLPAFHALLNEGVLRTHPQLRYSSGPENKHIVKESEGLDFKLTYRNLQRVPDTLRTTVICPSLSSLHEAIVAFAAHLKAQDIDYSVINFYNNAAKFGELDRSEGNFTGYIGVHFRVALTLPAQLEKGFAELSRLAVEVQFHPQSLYDGSEECIKARTHEAYRAWHKREVEALGIKERVRSALEMYYAYAIWACPTNISKREREEEREGEKDNKVANEEQKETKEDA